MSLELEQIMAKALEGKFYTVDGTDKERGTVLSDDDLVTIVTMIMDGKSFDEVADELDCTVEKVKRKWKMRYEWKPRIMNIIADRAEQRFEQVKRDYLRVATPRDTVFMADILRAVSALFGISAREICSNRRQVYVVRARHIYFTICRRLTEQSFPAIGRSCGDRDHSTVCHGIDKVEANTAAYEPELSRVMAMMECHKQAA